MTFTDLLSIVRESAALALLDCKADGVETTRAACGSMIVRSIRDTGQCPICDGTGDLGAGGSCDACEGSGRLDIPSAGGEVATESGYSHCACRDCFEIAISTKGRPPAMCNDCEAAGCEGGESECNAPGAYGAED